MTINPLIAQWDSNQSTQRSPRDEQVGRWIREVEDDKPSQAVASRRRVRWLPAMVAAGALLSVLLGFLV